VRRRFFVYLQLRLSGLLMILRSCFIGEDVIGVVQSGLYSASFTSFGLFEGVYFRLLFRRCTGTTVSLPVQLFLLVDSRFKEFHDRVAYGLLLRLICSCRLIFELFRFFKSREVGGLRFVILILFCYFLGLLGIREKV
jgi:hypothetical protein